MHCAKDDHSLCKTSIHSTRGVILLPSQMSNGRDDSIISTGGKGDSEEEGVKREPSYTGGGNGNWCSRYEKLYGASLKN